MAEQKMRYIAQRMAGEDPAPRARKKEEEIWIKKEYLLFDLDGTLTDPKLGITGCVQYALKAFGIEEPDTDKLEAFIGPPLAQSFVEFYGFDEDKANAAVEKYRERFRDTGIFENEIYAGIPQMLKKLKLRGIHLGVASSKPTEFVERILEHFGIREYFEVVVGSEMDGSRSEKKDVVLEALRRFEKKGSVQKQKVFMIGDRKYDVEGAHALGVECVGVTFGYGSMEELMEAHADYIVRSVEELRRFLLRGYEDMEKDLTQFQKMWVLIYHMVLFVAVRGLVMSFGRDLLRAGGVENLAADGEKLLTALAYFAGGAAILPGAIKAIKRAIRDMYLTHLKPDPKGAYGILAVAALGISQGVSMLLSLSGMAGRSQAYQNVEASQMDCALWISVLLYVLISPAAEELLFRGVIYGYVRRFFDIRTAVVGSAILFGIYHGNMIQAVYAVIMGYFIAYAYEYFGSFKVPLLLHMGINLLMVIFSYSGLDRSGFVCWPVCIAFLLLGIVALFLLGRRKKVM